MFVNPFSIKKVRLLPPLKLNLSKLCKILKTKSKTLKKIKSKFAAGLLESLKLPLQPFQQWLMLGFHNGHRHSKNLATFAVKCLKCV